jgi:hypothetical protein
MFTPASRGGAIAALLLMLVLAACGGADTSRQSDAPGGPSAASSLPGDSSAAPASGDEPTGAGLCALVPIEQVETALGMATDGGIGDESVLTGGSSCRFTADADHVLDVELSEQTRDEWFAAIETVGLTDESVEGVGEEAYRAAGTALGGPGARFSAWAGGREVGVTIYSDADQEVSFAAAQAIAEAVLAAGD